MSRLAQHCRQTQATPEEYATVSEIARPAPAEYRTERAGPALVLWWESEDEQSRVCGGIYDADLSESAREAVKDAWGRELVAVGAADDADEIAAGRILWEHAVISSEAE